MSEYLSVAETAKLVRAALKESFPGIKFSVRSKSYSGGASINVGWTDGPNTRQVEAITGTFTGGYFDGMTDYKGSRYHMLDGKRVHFCADFIFCNRDNSDAAVERALHRILADGVTDPHGKHSSAPTVETFRKGRLYDLYTVSNCTDLHWSVQEKMHEIMGKHSDRLIVAESATVARVKYLGDDGYGYGATGPVHLQSV